MKKILFILTALFVLTTGMSGCDKEEEKNLSPNPLQGTKWKLAGYTINEEKMLRILEPQDCERCYTIIFKSDNTLEGMSSTNEFSGEYEVDLKSSSLQIRNLVGTKINEVFDGQYYADAIKNVKKFGVFDDKLTLYCNENDCLYFQPQVASCDCEEKEVVKVLSDEPAYVRYNRILECYTFELLSSYEELIRHGVIRPCETDIPQKYKIDGLPVKISGNVIQCKFEEMPNARLYLYNRIELTDIKRR
ncbi:META domain-containing protein [Viscerimonas tarda]